jgi:arabinofuranan 3-O-arabinosyltransferase
MTDTSTRFLRFLFDRRTLLATAWVIALALAAGRIINGHLGFQDRRPKTDPNRRVDGNHGHTSIDFSGQWVMGRLLVRGYGKELYSRPRQWEVIQQAYPPERECPDAKDHDPRLVIQHFIGSDDPGWKEFAGSISALAGSSGPFQRSVIAIESRRTITTERLDELNHPKGPEGIGGPLYPPIHAFFMAPFALGDHPQAAYFAMQWIQAVLCFVAGLGVSRLSQGRIWWPVASTLILAYPGCRGVIDLGQNSALSLSLLIWGWVFMARRRPMIGGVFWGFLAYKPVWAVSFWLFLLLIHQWRAALAMSVTGAAIALMTIPFVGVQSWLHWLKIGQDAAAIYNVDGNWVPLSRDILGIPRRFFIDFDIPRPERENLVALVSSWVLWAFVVEMTLRVLVLSGKRPIPFTGPIPAMLILATWMCTFHFMYYDALISAFGVCVLLADPRPFFRPRALFSRERPVSAESNPRRRRSRWLINSFALTIVALLIFHENVTFLMKIEVTGVAHSQTSKRTLPDGSTEMAPRFIVGTSDRYPWDTVMIAMLWTWCWMTILTGRWPEEGTRSRDPPKPIEGGPDVGRAQK